MGRVQKNSSPVGNYLFSITRKSSGHYPNNTQADKPTNQIQYGLKVTVYHDSTFNLARSELVSEMTLGRTETY